MSKLSFLADLISELNIFAARENGRRRREKEGTDEDVKRAEEFYADVAERGRRGVGGG